MTLPKVMGDWSLRAECRGVKDPDIFFPDSGPGHDREAKAVCARCPVTVECLAYSQAGAIEHGIFGGLGGGPRIALRRRERELVA